MSDADKIADFIARKGATRVAEGVAARDTLTVQQREEQRLIEQRIVVGGRVRNGLGEWIA